MEIGSGHGAAAIAFCLAHPDADLVAVEVHVPGVARMLAAAQEAGVDNLWVHPGDALPFLTERVAPDSLDAVHLFFPDPWPKQRAREAAVPAAAHARPARVPARARRGAARRHGLAGYAAHARSQLAHHGRWTVVEGERPDWRPDDGFEAKGLRAGRAVTELALRTLRDRAVSAVSSG